MKRTVKLTEKELKRMISESVKGVINEIYNKDIEPSQLSNILYSMSDHVNHCLSVGEDITPYYREIINTKLYHDVIDFYFSGEE
jgi:hypothetical protein